MNIFIKNLKAGEASGVDVWPLWDPNTRSSQPHWGLAAKTERNKPSVVGTFHKKTKLTVDEMQSEAASSSSKPSDGVQGSWVIEPQSLVIYKTQ